MTTRTTVVLVAAAVALAAYIAVVDSRLSGTTERRIAAEQVFPDVDPERVDRLEIRFGGKRVVLVKEGAVWRMRAPVRWRADLQTVENALSAVDFAVPVRKVAAQWKTADHYGLQHPAVRVTVGSGSSALRFRVGSRDVTGRYRYTARDDRPGTVYVVEEDLYTAFARAPDGWRDGRLIYDVPKGDVEVRGPDAALRLQRGAQGYRVWWKDQWVRASDRAVKAFLAAMRDARAVSFGGGSGRFVPRYVVAVAGTPLLSVGGACSGGVQVRREKDGARMCADEALASLLAAGPERFVETRLAPLDARDVTGVTVVEGADTVRLERPEDTWVLRDAAFAVDQRLQAEVESLVRRTGEPWEGAAPQGDPDKVVTLTGSDASVALSLWRRDDGWLVRRDEEGVLFWVSSDFAQAFPAFAQAYRRKELAVGPGRIERIAIDGPVSQQLGRQDGAWRLVAPVAMEADPHAAQEMENLLAAVPVAAFVRGCPADGCGFGAPHMRVAVTTVRERRDDSGADLTASEEAVLVVGNALPDGNRFGRISTEPDAVFTVSSAALAPLTQLAASLRAVAWDTARAHTVTVEADGRTAVFRRVGDGWSSAQCRGGGAALGAVMTTIASMKAAEAVRVGSLADGVRLTVATDAGTRTFVFVQEAGRDLVQRDDLPVVYALTNGLGGQVRALCNDAKDTP